ncbi:MAG: hypothetical protein M3O70_01300 [Actinomycetota bacterium]|nr:hypothetical protein [Actinomycetota bacterium]
MAGQRAAAATSALEASDVYAATLSSELAPAVAGMRPLVYVPKTRDATADVIDPATIAQGIAGRVSAVDCPPVPPRGHCHRNRNRQGAAAHHHRTKT